MRILLTNPPWISRQYMFLGDRIGVRAGSRWPFSVKGKTLRYIPYPGFMGYATSYLQSQGIDAIFYDAVACQHTYKEFFRKVDYYHPDIVIQETSTPSLVTDLQIARSLHNKKYEVCLVGPHASAFAGELAGLPFVDYVLKGAYEYPALTMCQERKKGVYDYNIAPLDNLPYPYRDKEIIGYYRDYNCLKKLDFPQLWVYASRGCVFKCDFCLWQHTMFEKNYSLRSAAKVLTEIEEMAALYGFKHIYFDDDCWNIGSPDRLKELADGLKKMGLPWTINARIDLSSEEMFKYFVDRGCAGLRIGVESLSQRLLDITKKDLKVETIIKKIKYLEGLDVELYLLFMHYLPGEEQGDRQEQEKMIKKLGLRSQNPPCIPFPGTPYFQKIKDAGFNLSKDIIWSEYDGGQIGRKLLEISKRYSKRIKL